MGCDHLFTGWRTTAVVLGGVVIMTWTRSFVLCKTVEHTDGEQQRAAA